MATMVAPQGTSFCPDFGTVKAPTITQKFALIESSLAKSGAEEPSLKGALITIVSSARALRESRQGASDELTDCWLYLKRASAEFALDLKEEATFPDNKWPAENQPPSMADIQLLTEFAAWLTARSSSIGDAYDATVQRSNSFTVFSLRTALYAFGINKETANITEDPASCTFAALIALLRPPDTTISRDRFCKLKAFLDMELRANEYLSQETGSEPVLLLEEAGYRARTIVRLAQKASSFKEATALLIHCGNLLDLEPRSSCHVLLMESNATPIAALCDMVLRLGYKTIHEHKDLILRLWDLCAKVVQRSACLGKPKAESRKKVRTPDKANLNLPRRSSAILGVFAKQRTWSGKTMAEVLSETAKTGKPTKSSSAKDIQQATPPKFGMSPMILRDDSAPNLILKRNPQIKGSTRSLPEPPSATTLSPKKDAPASGDAPTSVGTQPRRQTFFTLKKVSRVVPGGCPEDDQECGVAEKSADEKQSDIASKDSPLRQAGSDACGSSEECINAEAPSDSGGGKVVMRRAGAKLSMLRKLKTLTCAESELDEMHAEPEPLPTPFTSEASDKAWELRVCTLFWKAVPAQSITFAIGVGLQTLTKRGDVLRMLRAAWSLFDKTRAVECYIGTLGTARLRLQLEALADNRIVDESAMTDLETARPMITKAGQTAVRLGAVCRADDRFARIAVLYGGYFLVERLLWQLQATCGEYALELDPYLEILNTLKPHLKDFFSPKTPAHA